MIFLDDPCVNSFRKTFRFSEARLNFNMPFSTKRIAALRRNVEHARKSAPNHLQNAEHEETSLPATYIAVTSSVSGEAATSSSSTTKAWQISSPAPLQSPDVQSNMEGLVTAKDIPDEDTIHAMSASEASTVEVPLFASTAESETSSEEDTNKNEMETNERNISPAEDRSYYHHNSNILERALKANLDILLQNTLLHGDQLIQLRPFVVYQAVRLARENKSFENIAAELKLFASPPSIRNYIKTALELG